MKYFSLIGGLAILVGSLSGCGGGGGGGGSSAPIIGLPVTAVVAPASPPATTQYFTYVPLVVGTISVFSSTSTTNFNNTITQTIRQKVTVVNADGSSSFLEDDPTASTVTDHATDYSIIPTTSNVDSSDRVTQLVQQPSTGSPVTCTYSPYGIGPTYPVAIGNTWSYSYVYQCGAQPATYNTQGSVVGLETVTVPAGTFSTFKTQSTTSGPYAGTTGVASATNWRDTANGHLVKSVTTYSYDGKPTDGARLSTTQALQSRQ